MRSWFAWVSLCLTACYGVPAQEVLGPRDTLARTEPEQRCERDCQEGPFHRSDPRGVTPA